MYGTDGWHRFREFTAEQYPRPCAYPFRRCITNAIRAEREHERNQPGSRESSLSPISSYSLQALQNERRWELAFESIRWNDIRRWHIAAAALEKQTNVKIYTNGQEDSNKAHGGGYATRYNATAGFFKIPESEVDMSNGSITQNAGWEGSDSNITDGKNDFNKVKLLIRKS